METKELRKINAINVYMSHFRNKYFDIMKLLDFFKNEEKCIVLWGAGRRGIAFLRAYDPAGEYISFVIDMNKQKSGQMVDSYRRIYSIKEIKKDKKYVVFLSSDAFENSARYQLYLARIDAMVINVDNIIWGNLSAEEILNQPLYDMHPVRNTKICAMVILYQPNEFVIKNISSYAAFLDKLFIYDNSEDDCIFPWSQFSEDCMVEYIRHHENRGIGAAINEVAGKAINDGYDWLITYDQDSMATVEMVPEMRKFANDESLRNDVALITPLVNDTCSQEYVPTDVLRLLSKPPLYYKERALQSGTMHRLSLWGEIGGYNEDLFIQEVDFEFCVRCVLNGKKIVQLNDAVMIHQIDEKREIQKTSKKKYTPLTYYYLYRNALYCLRKYRKIAPLFALSCADILYVLEKASETGMDSMNKKTALSIATHDFENRIMGKIISEKLHLIG